MLQFICTLLNFFLQWSIVFQVQVFYLLSILSLCLWDSCAQGPCPACLSSLLKKPFWAHPLHYWITIQFSTHTTSPKSLKFLSLSWLQPASTQVQIDPSLSRALSCLAFAATAMGVLPAVCVNVACISLTLCIQVTPSPGMKVLCHGRGRSHKVSISD